MSFREKRPESHILQHALPLADRWRLAGRWGDAHTLLFGVEPVARDLDPKAHASVWLQIGKVLTDQGMFQGADTQATRDDALARALDLAEPTGDDGLLGAVYDAQGFSIHATYLAGDRAQEPPDELELFERALTHRERVGDPRGVAESLFHVGLVYDVIRRDYDRARDYHQRAYDIALEAGDQVTASYAIRHLGFAHLHADEVDRAEAALADSLRLREEAGFVPGIAFALMALAHVSRRKGNADGALAYLARSRRILETLGATSRVEWVDGQVEAIRGGGAGER